MRAEQDLFSNSANLAEVEIYYKYKVNPSELPVVKCSDDTVKHLRTVWNSNNIDRIEEFMVLCLNRSHKVLGYSKISQGGFAGTVADPKVIFQVALKTNASSIILAHNHPSGHFKPSENDIQLTRKLKKAGEYLDLTVLDHIILTSEGYMSFADDGLL